MAKYRKTKITPSFAITNVVQDIALVGTEGTLWILTGNVWIDIDARTDLSEANGFKLTANSVMDLETTGSFTIISDINGATAQIIERRVL